MEIVKGNIALRRGRGGSCCYGSKGDNLKLILIITFDNNDNGADLPINPQAQ